ncbi:alpha/beta fold hydrolase [Burkholderia ubonensis]|nr:alpha/beta fold hydrolase [Burkholderia ubonensis]
MFTFPLDPAALFEERRAQFVGWGIPAEIVARMERRIDDCWSESPGGWACEWWDEAERAAARQDWLLASLLYGAARFPVACTPLRRDALRRQVDCFMRAAPTFRAHFERVTIRSEHAEGGAFPVHVYRPARESERPVVCLSGGVDTGKMELHRLAQILARVGRFDVVAMDMPGTGESGMCLQADSDAAYRSVLSQVAGQRKKAILGVSFGGHWAAKLALQHEVDAAVDLGGPIGAADREAGQIRHLPNGMTGIVANAMRLPALPDEQAADELLARFSLHRQGLLDQIDCAPLLAVNGADDPYIPSGDVRVFERYPAATVWPLAGLGHCAAEKIGRVVPAIIAWLYCELRTDSLGGRLALTVAERLLPRRERSSGNAEARAGSQANAA